MKKILIFLVMAICMFACSKEIKKTDNDIVIKVCEQTSPEWLISEINSIIEPVLPNHRPVSVYSTVFNDVTYVLVTDMVNNAITYQLRFFLCSGELVSYGTEEYNVLKQRYYDNREEYTLLWSNSNTQSL